MNQVQLAKTVTKYLTFPIFHKNPRQDFIYVIAPMFKIDLNVFWAYNKWFSKHFQSSNFTSCMYMCSFTLNEHIYMPYRIGFSPFITNSDSCEVSCSKCELGFISNNESNGFRSLFLIQETWYLQHIFVSVVY